MTYVNSCGSVELQRAALQKRKSASSLLAVEAAQFLLRDEMEPIRFALENGNAEPPRASFGQ